MKEIKALWFLLPLLFFLASCGGATSPTVPSSPPISVEYLDGAGDVALDSSFEATFSQPVDTDTVTTTTFFVVATASANIASPIKATYDSTICNSANALAATVACASSTACTLDLTSDLASGTQYTACLMPGAGSGGSRTGIFYADGTAYGGFRATFTTLGAVPTLIDGKGNSISASTTGLTGVFASSFRLIFSETMDPATLTTANVPYACQDANPSFAIAPALTTDLAQSNKTFDITITDPHLYQITDCTLDVTAGVKTATGASVSATNYAFKTGCAVNDTFTTDTSECWTVSTAAGVTWSTWPDLLANILMFDGSDLGYSTVGQAGATTARIYKSATFLSSGFQLTLNVDNPAGFNSGADNDDLVALELRNNDNMDIVLRVGIVNVAAVPWAYMFFVNNSTGDQVEAWSMAPLDSPASYSITIAVDTTNGMQASYTRNGVSLPLQGPVGTPFPTAATINNALLQHAGETWTLSLRFIGEADLSATIKSISTSGLSSATQY